MPSARLADPEKWWWPALALAVLVLLYFLSPILAPFLLGCILALITPALVGRRVGLHPVAVIFALLAFGQIFGFFGVLLAPPASAAPLMGLRHLRSRYYASSFCKD